MIKTIFFDVDGTLYDEKNAKVKAEVDVARFVSKETDLPLCEVYSAYIAAKKKVMAAMPRDPRRNDRMLWYRRLAEGLRSDIDAEDLAEKYWAIVVNEISPYPDLLAVLPEISESYSLWVLTDELLDLQERKLKRLGLGKYFEGVISSVHAGAVKPDARLFKYALKEADAAAKAAAMIGDNPKRDIAGANAAGLISIWFRRGKYYYYPAQGDEKPRYTLESYMDLPGLLASI